MTAALLLLLITAPGEAAAGRALFHDPGVGKNGVACASCHATVADEAKDGDGLIRAGHSLAGVAKRKYWRGDQKRSVHPTLAEAVDVCVQLFQGGTPLDGKARVALDAYLKSLGKGSGAPLELQPALEADLDYDRDKYRGGDATAGRGLFYRACSGCHPRGEAGLGPRIAGKAVPEVARKVREGNGLLRGARKPNEWMPFFGSDRLSDRELADLAAYVAAMEH